MEKSQKIQILESFLRSRGLSLDDPDVKRFFFEQRKTRGAVSKENYKQKLAYGAIEPKLYRIQPIHFMNNGYLENVDSSSIMDWLMYSNYEDNPLVFDNLGKDQSSIRDSFEERRRIARPAFMDVEGNVYNGEDGNHRLLSLMINQFVDFACCKNDAERQAVKDKYALFLEVSLPHDKELCTLLEREKNKFVDYPTDENCGDFIPYAVREFRHLHTDLSDTYLASYDDKTKTYFYDFNGTKFSGSCEELKNFLRTKKQETLPVMLWTCGKETFLSHNNFVIKSENKQFLEKRLGNMRASREMAKSMPKTDYLIVYDADKEKYDIIVPQMNIPEGRGKAKIELVNFLQDFAENLSNDQFFELAGKSQQALLKECSDGRNGFAMYVPELKFENLSAEEYALVANVLKENEEFVSKRLNVLNNSDELQTFANNVVKMLPEIDFANESLRSIASGIIKNPRTANAKRVAFETRNTFNFGKTMAQWGCGKIRNEIDAISEIEEDVVRMPQYEEIEHIKEKQAKIEEHFASDRVYGEESVGYLRDLLVELDGYIATLENIAHRAKNPKLASLALDLIQILERDASACEKLLTAVYSKDKNQEDEQRK